MDQVEISEDMLKMIQVLSDPERLKLIAQLSQGEFTPDELAKWAQTEPTTISKNLDVLEKAGLVERVTSGDDVRYVFNKKKFESFNRNRFASKKPSVDLSALNLTDEEKKIILNYLQKDGSLKSIPSQEKKMMIILKYVAVAFTPGQIYSEREINSILSRYNPDSTTLRRYLINHNFLCREKDGTKYWVLVSKQEN
jgi:predicted transcriptional regulator